MRSSLRLFVLSLVGASLIACSDREIMPTGITPREASKDFINVTIDPNRFTAITAGNDFTCAVQNYGNVYCWGQADHLQVGRSGMADCFNQISSPSCVPRPSLVKKPLDGTPVSALVVDAGGYHACALERQTGQVWCWGAGGAGQLGLGNGLTTDSSLAAAVPGMTNVSLISAGTVASCAQKRDGVFCWGRLNPSSRNDALAPVRWEISPNYLDLSVGDRHACAIAAPDRSVVCWGANDFGQSANTLRGNPGQHQPVGTLFGSPVTRVITQDNTTCVEMNGTTQCAGQNRYGMFGNTTALGSFTATPQTRIAGGPLHNITVGVNHSCGLDANGAAFCWGDNHDGQLGNNDPTYTSTANPQPVAGGHRFVAIAAGANHTCAIRTDNLLYCWGDNRSGQLGAWVNSSRVPVPTDSPVW